MRKTSYFVTFLAVVVTLVLNVWSVRSPDWLVVKSPEVFYTKVTVRYGLMERCERDVIELPGPSTGGKIAYTDYNCSNFPARVSDRCEKENRSFCTAWISAGYATELAIGFAAMALLSLMIGVTTHSRRRRIWRAVAVLVGFHALFQIVAFAIITDLYRTSQYPPFEQARPGISYVLNAVSWIAATLITFGVVTTGISADMGHRWAAGNRAYQPIQG